MLAGAAQAGYSYTDYPEDICATEAIYLDGVSPNVQGVTGSGIAYTVSQTQVQNLYSENYTSFNPRRATVTIRFDKPMAAIGAMISVDGFGSYAPNASEMSGLDISQSGYRGVVATPGSIQEVTFSTNNGPFTITRIDIRPLPLSANDRVTVYMNSDKIYDAGTLLRNDLHADGAVVVEPPLHAQKFEISEDGSFVYQPVKNYEGIDSFTYRATNGLGTTFSAPATVEINVAHVNCAPQFLKGDDVSCVEDDGLQTIPGWATAMDTGSEMEPDQTLSWDVTVDQPGLFSQAPAIAQDGTLTYQPALYQSGAASVTVRLHDDGGIENGGLDTSEPQTFVITISPIAHAPMLEPIMDCAVRAGDALILSARATMVDADTPVTYSLERAPQGATIDPLTGQVIWRPGQEMAGEMPEFTVRASQAGNDALSSVTRFRVEVLANARPPEILPIENLEATPGLEVNATVAAKKAANMRYFLASDIPGAMLNPTTGAFHWQPSAADAGKTVNFAVTAVDLESPNLCAMKTFSVHVGTAIAFAKDKSAKQILAKAKGLQTTGQAAMKFAAPAKSRSKK